MTKWALIENDSVKELTDIDPEGRFHPDFVWVVAPKSVQVGYSYKDGKFSAPPATSEEDLAAMAQATKNSYMDVATRAIAPLQDAVDLGMATEAEEAALLEWKKYRVLLNRVEQQEGYPSSVEWPAMPE